MCFVFLTALSHMSYVVGGSRLVGALRSPELSVLYWNSWATQAKAAAGTAFGGGSTAATAVDSQDQSPGHALLAQVCTPADLEKDADGVLETFAEQAECIINKYLTFVVEPESSTQLADMLRPTQVVKRQSTGTVGCIYLTQHAGESDCHPHVRQPRFRADHLKLVVNGLATASSAEGVADELPQNCHVLVCDAGQGGNENAISRCFLQQDGKMMPKLKNTIYLMLDEESLNERKARVTGRVNL